MSSTEPERPGQAIDLDEVERLIDALERDLANAHGDASDIQRLKDEVQTLKNVLHSPVRRHHWVRDSLHAIRDAFEDAVAKGVRGSQYIAEIGRILGM